MVVLAEGIKGRKIAQKCLVDLAASPGRGHHDICNSFLPLWLGLWETTGACPTTIQVAVYLALGNSVGQATPSSNTHTFRIKGM
jgi:hypothetical protein